MTTTSGQMLGTLKFQAVKLREGDDEEEDAPGGGADKHGRGDRGQGSGLDPQPTDRWQQTIGQLAEIGAAALDKAIEKKLIPPQNTKIVAYCVLGMYERVAYRWVVEEQSTELDVLAEALTRYEMLGIGGTAASDIEAAIRGELY